MFRSFLLLLLAIVSLILLAVPLFIWQTLRNIAWGTLKEFFFGLALAIDYFFAYLIFGVYGHTVSALTYNVWLDSNGNGLGWFMNFINYLFQDEDHCKIHFEKEFNIKGVDDGKR